MPRATRHTHFQKTAMPQVDLRVQAAINERMPSLRYLKEVLPPCTNLDPREHEVVVEYGQTKWANIGLAVCEVCRRYTIF